MENIELRIGNYIMYGDGKIAVDINILRDLNTYLSLGIKPIEITEEWLLSLGFLSGVKLFDSIRYKKGRIYVIITDSICVFAIKNEATGGCCRIKKLKYIHDLQNTYYCNENKELTLKS